MMGYLGLLFFAMAGAYLLFKSWMVFDLYKNPEGGGGAPVLDGVVGIPLLTILGLLLLSRGGWVQDPSPIAYAFAGLAATAAFILGMVVAGSLGARSTKVRRVRPSVNEYVMKVQSAGTARAERARSPRKDAGPELTREQARDRALAYLRDGRSETDAAGYGIRDDLTVTKPYGWHFTWESKVPLIGLGPIIIVNRKNGTVTPSGSGEPVGRFIRDYERNENSGF